MPAGTSDATKLALDAVMDAGLAAETTGEWAAALEHYETAFGQLGREGGAGRAAELLCRIGRVRRQRGETELARELFEAALAVAERTDSGEQAAAALNALAELERLTGRVSAAENLYGQARRLAQASGDERALARVDESLAALATERGDLPAALFSYTSALFRYRRVGDLRSAVETLNGMGAAHADLGELDEAAACFDQAFELASAAQDPPMLGRVQARRAELFLRRQQYEQARQCCDDSFGIFTQLDAKQSLAAVYRHYGALYRETGKPHLAEVHLGLAWKLCAQVDDRPMQAEVQHELARMHLEAERNLEAIACLNRAYALYRVLGEAGELPDIDTPLDSLETTYLNVIRQWSADIIESKDPYTNGHSQRVADYTVALAEAAGIAGRELGWLRIGALLHDVGKTIVPSAVLGKPGVLNESEWSLMRQHTVAGDEIVNALGLPFDVGPMVRSHHERWDGRGYPDGLAGEEIPLMARVLSVADVYDALTSRRSYRNAFLPREARRILRHQAGRALDPVLVERFERLPDLG